MATVRLTPEAEAQARRLPKPIRARVVKLADRLAKWPAVSGAKPLSGNLTGWYRLRTGDYRVRFRVEGKTVVVDKIGHIKPAAPQKKSGLPKSAATHRTIRGKRVVILPEAEYDRLKQRADEWEPLMPELGPDGTFPAVEALRVSLARDIIRQRRRLGLTQVELARRAGIRPETLNRIESGKVSPSVATVERIDRALREAEAQDGG